LDEDHGFSAEVCLINPKIVSIGINDLTNFSGNLSIRLAYIGKELGGDLSPKKETKCQKKAQSIHKIGNAIASRDIAMLIRESKDAFKKLMQETGPRIIKVGGLFNHSKIPTIIFTERY
jgi:hypothetical protein